MSRLKIEYVDPLELKPNPRNPRINDAAAQKVTVLIGEHGFNVPIVTDQNLNILAGHTRWKAAQQMGLTEVPVIRVKFESEARALAFALADNKSNEWADWDLPVLKDLLQELDTGEFNMELTGFDEGQISDLMTRDDLWKDNGDAGPKEVDCPQCGHSFIPQRKRIAT